MIVECYTCHKLGHYQNKYQFREENTNIAEFKEGVMHLIYQ